MTSFGPKTIANTTTGSMQAKFPSAKSSDLTTLSFTPDTFEPVYHAIAGLKFPADVAQVLELRYLINHAVDAFPEPASTQDYRDFCDALQGVIDSIGVENKRHGERLLRILTMMRELHYHYTIKTRDAEAALRAEMATNRRHRQQSVRYGLIFSVGAIMSGLVWLGLPDPGWPVQLLTAALAVLAWLYLHALPGLDKDLRTQEQRLHQLLRGRVKSIHWRLLAQKLALLLGYRHNSGVEVFRIDNDFELPGHSRLHH